MPLRYCHGAIIDIRYYFAMDIAFHAARLRFTSTLSALPAPSTDTPSPRHLACRPAQPPLCAADARAATFFMPLKAFFAAISAVRGQPLLRFIFFDVRCH